MNRSKDLLCCVLILREFHPAHRFLRLSEDQGAPALPFDFPELSLTTTLTNNDADSRSFIKDPTALSEAEVKELYTPHVAPVTVHWDEDSKPPLVAVLGSKAAAGASATSQAKEQSIEDHTKATSYWFCASCGGNTTSTAFAHCLHCGLPRSHSSRKDSSDGRITKSSVARQPAASISMTTSSTIETLPESDLTSEVRNANQK